MSPERMSIIEQIEKNKKILRAEYQKGYIAGSEKTRQELIEEFLEDMGFDGECYKMSIKNHEKWEGGT